MKLVIENVLSAENNRKLPLVAEHTSVDAITEWQGEYHQRWVNYSLWNQLQLLSHVILSITITPKFVKVNYNTGFLRCRVLSTSYDLTCLI